MIKRLLTVFGGFFLLVTVVNGILYLWQWRPTRQKFVAPPSSVEKVAQWPTLRNESLRLTLVIVPPFQLTLETDEHSDIVRMMAPTASEAADVKLEILNFENTEQLSVVEWVGQYSQNQDTPSLQFISRTVDGEPALSEEEMTSLTARQTTYVAFAQKIYIINVFFVDRADIPRYQEAVDRVTQSIMFHHAPPPGAGRLGCAVSSYFPCQE